MHTPPKNLTEQLMNLCERLAHEMRIIANSHKDHIFRKDWETLKALAFKDTIQVTEIDVMYPVPAEVFKAFMALEVEITPTPTAKFSPRFINGWKDFISTTEEGSTSVLVQSSITKEDTTIPCIKVNITEDTLSNNFYLDFFNIFLKDRPTDLQPSTIYCIFPIKKEGSEAFGYYPATLTLTDFEWNPSGSDEEIVWTEDTITSALAPTKQVYTCADKALSAFADTLINPSGEYINSKISRMYITTDKEDFRTQCELLHLIVEEV